MPELSTNSCRRFAESANCSNRAASFLFEAINRLCVVLSEAGVIRPHLEEQALLNAAQKKIGLFDFGNENFREGLSVLLDSARRDVKFHVLGQLSFRDFIVRMLTNRLLLCEARKHWTKEMVPLKPPLIVTGLARSGTTFLHRLLGQDPANRVLPLWKLLKPVPDGNGRDRHRLQTELQLRMMACIAPDLDKKHYTRADTPEECIVLLASSFVSLIYYAMAPVYSYAEWYMKHDLLTGYKEYRTQLELLQQSVPYSRLALKAPDHMAALDVIEKVIPEAMVVQSHRDPTECVHSVNSLQLSLYSMMVRELDAKKMVKANLDYLANEMERNMAYHGSGRNNIFHVSYKALVYDPLACMKAIYEHFRLHFTEAFEKNIVKYIQLNPKGGRGMHHYRQKLFGLRDEEIMERFSPYTNQFLEYL